MQLYQGRKSSCVYFAVLDLIDALCGDGNRSHDGVYRFVETFAKQLSAIHNRGASMRASSRGSLLFHGLWSRVLLGLANPLRSSVSRDATNDAIAQQLLAGSPALASYSAQCGVLAYVASNAGNRVGMASSSAEAGGFGLPAETLAQGVRQGVGTVKWSASQMLSRVESEMRAADFPTSADGFETAVYALTCLVAEDIGSSQDVVTVHASTGAGGIFVPCEAAPGSSLQGSSVTLIPSRTGSLLPRTVPALELHVSVRGLEVVRRWTDGSGVANTSVSPLAGWPEVGAVHFSGAPVPESGSDAAAAGGPATAWRVTLLLQTDVYLLRATPLLQPLVDDSTAAAVSASSAPAPAAPSPATGARNVTLDLLFPSEELFASTRRSMITMRPQFVGRGAAEATRAVLGAAAAAGDGPQPDASAPAAVSSARAGPQLFDCLGGHGNGSCTAHCLGVCASAQPVARASPIPVYPPCGALPIDEAPQLRFAQAYLALSESHREFKRSASHAGRSLSRAASRTTPLPREASVRGGPGSGVNGPLDAHGAVDASAGPIAAPLQVNDDAHDGGASVGGDSETDGCCSDGDSDAETDIAEAPASPRAPRPSVLTGLTGRLPAELLMLNELGDDEARDALRLADAPSGQDGSGARGAAAGRGASSAQDAFFASLSSARAPKVSVSEGLLLRPRAHGRAAARTAGLEGIMPEEREGEEEEADGDRSRSGARNISHLSGIPGPTGSAGRESSHSPSVGQSLSPRATRPNSTTILRPNSTTILPRSLAKRPLPTADAGAEARGYGDRAPAGRENKRRRVSILLPPQHRYDSDGDLDDGQGPGGEAGAGAGEVTTAHSERTVVSEAGAEEIGDGDDGEGEPEDDGAYGSKTEEEEATGDDAAGGSAVAHTAAALFAQLQAVLSAHASSQGDGSGSGTLGTHAPQHSSGGPASAAAGSLSPTPAYGSQPGSASAVEYYGLSGSQSQPNDQQLLRVLSTVRFTAAGAGGAGATSSPGQSGSELLGRLQAAFSRITAAVESNSRIAGARWPAGLGPHALRDALSQMRDGLRGALQARAETTVRAVATEIETHERALDRSTADHNAAIAAAAAKVARAARSAVKACTASTAAIAAADARKQAAALAAAQLAAAAHVEWGYEDDMALYEAKVRLKAAGDGVLRALTTAEDAVGRLHAAFREAAAGVVVEME